MPTLLASSEDCVERLCRPEEHIWRSGLFDLVELVEIVDGPSAAALGALIRKLGAVERLTVSIRANTRAQA